IREISVGDQYGKINAPVRLVSTVETKPLQKDEGFIKKLLNKIPFLNVNKSRIMASGYLLYEGVADKINYVEFFEELNLPDTFYSWFVITELHIWMISVRAMAEGDAGRMLRNYLVEALWADVQQRVKKLGASNPAVARLQIAELSEQLQAAIIGYDEGLQSDDTILAGALWRRFYQQGEVEPSCLNRLVKYTRRHVSGYYFNQSIL
ncbi:ubiquinol-cytochrome-c reductase complex assembly factor 1, partial [Asbolus verrucosus]